MKHMQPEPQDWRELLGNIISDPHEKQRIAQELGIRPITLTRWVTGESEPRQQNLRHLLNIVPEERDLLLDLISEEFVDFTAEAMDDSSKDIPSEFYGRVFSAQTATNETLHFWSICNLILQQAIGQLDPDRLGLAITVACCMPPSDGNKVRSLRESVGQGTPPWSGDLEQQGMFLGAESLAGYAVTTCRPAAIQDIHQEISPLPAHQIPNELSAAAHPILFTGRIAGCLLISSTQTNYFLSPSRLSLIQCYANLLALAFDTEEFYDSQDIELHVMPSHEVQKGYFRNFRHQVTQVIKQQPVPNRQAEEIVWQQLEEELVQLSAP